MATSLPLLTIMFLLVWVSADVTSLQYLARAMSYDWHFKQQKLPPQRETVELPELIEDGIQFNLLAFGKKWTISLKLNNILINNSTRISERSSDDVSVRIYDPPIGCLFLGTASADQSEFGLVSLSTCGDQVHGLIATNLNDYALFETDWKSRRSKRSSSISATLEVYDPSTSPHLW